MLSREQQIIADNIKGLLEILPTIAKLERELVNNPTNLELLANTAFICRKSEEVIKAIKKSLETLSYKAEEQACMQMVQLGIPKYSTNECTVSPNPDFYVKFPSSPEKEGYVDFVKQLSPDEIRPHYPTIEKNVNEYYKTNQKLLYGLTDIAGCALKLRVTSKKEL